MKAQLIRILTRAKGLVARGWIQGMAQNSTGTKVCAAQAIQLAALEETTLSDRNSVEGYFHQAGLILLSAARERTGEMGWGTIPLWNDTPGRTQQEVVDTFDHALKLVERDYK